MKCGRALAISIALLLFTTAASASWYDDYDAGLAAARKGQWSVVAQKMSASIAARPVENNSERAYGTIFYNYHPYYYRGVAYLNLGRFQQAVSDFEQTAGPGETDLGSLDVLLRRAKSKLEAPEPAPQTPTPVPVPAPRTPPPTPMPTNVIPRPQPGPATPSIDASLQARANSAVKTAREHLAAAQRRKATASSNYAEALRLVNQANTTKLTARSNEDLQKAIADAEASSLNADSAQAPVAVAATHPTRITAATNATLSDISVRLRTALDSYFRGDFDEAVRGLEPIANNDLPNNGWVWAFLGASQYSLYAFELEDHYKVKAMQAFSRAKRLNTFRNGLPPKYFSRRIRTIYASAG